ncbi:MAG: DEAD/DEAH box helicase [Chloroflexi bacterium]|nr:DEAD/DEAH box helicase [Chloroflexota bacterium]
MTFAVGSLVKARGREWVVLPDSDDDLLVLRPLGGTEDEVTGIYLPLETVQAASFDLPDPNRPGDFRSCRLLRDAVRLGFRSSAGPFRSFAQIAVEPRPYQLVPLLMALKLDPVRLLIADDVGIGKTIESSLIARELLDRGEVDRLAILCPPPLAEQWQGELRTKLHIDAELVLPSTAARLERACRLGESLFDRYPYVIVSTDFIKSDRRREEFLRACPELVIVDEAHTCADPGSSGRSGRHQRHQLVRGLAADRNRHLILVTATPHSGNDAAFRSLLTLLDSGFADLPEDLSGRQNEPHRRRLAAHFVQRRREDLRSYLHTDTPFPERLETEATYKLSPEYRRLFDRVLTYARETVADESGGRFRQRVRWWSALALLRSLASSPAAAAATLRSRAAVSETENETEADEIGRRTVLDLIEDEPAEGVDLAPGSDIGGDSDDERRTRRRLLDMAREADALVGAKDAKLQKASKIVRALLDEDSNPIVFCRFIPTAEAVADALRADLGKAGRGAYKDVEVVAVTGRLAPAEREERVSQLGRAPRRVLVATDCLSEGVNLQESFDAVLHYDLSWNPTRHEQREGRVDRYGQPSSSVRVVTYYGTDNQIDGIVLDVLLRKHKAIRKSLGVSVPVPVDTNQVVEAILEGLLLRDRPATATALTLPGFDALMEPETKELFSQWEAAEDREKRSRTLFAQHGIHVDEVAQELRAAQAAVGAGADVAGFVADAVRAHGGQATPASAGSVGGGGALRLDLAELSRALKEAVGLPDPSSASAGASDAQVKQYEQALARARAAQHFTARFEPPVRADERHLGRTDPFVEGLASYVMDTALDPLGDGVARRCGVIRTSKVERRTTVLLVRFRFHIVTRRDGEERPLLAEDCALLAFAGAPRAAEWLPSELAEALLEARPEANVLPDEATRFLKRIVDEFDPIWPALDDAARQRGADLLTAHRRVRSAARMASANSGVAVEPQLPPDVLGLFLYLPLAQ